MVMLCPALTGSRVPAPLRLQPAPSRRRTVLLFVFRDRTKTPLEKLIETWEGDLQRMWEGITKPPQYEQYTLTDFFDLQYAALSNYEDRQEEFLAESVLLRRKFSGGDGSGGCGCGCGCGYGRVVVCGLPGAWREPVGMAAGPGVGQAGLVGCPPAVARRSVFNRWCVPLLRLLRLLLVQRRRAASCASVTRSCRGTRWR